jgi:Sigma-70 region 2
MPQPTAMAMNMKSCDQLLVLRAQSGELSAFDELVCKYRHRIMKLSLRYTRNRADAEDAVQNTFIKAYGGFGAFVAMPRSILGCIASQLIPQRQFYRLVRGMPASFSPIRGRTTN